MSNIQKYNYQNIFFLEQVNILSSNAFSSSIPIEYYTVYWVRSGKGECYVDFKTYPFHENMLFFLSPGQVFSIKSNKEIKSCKISFTSDFYCIQTHDKSVACNGVLFNNVTSTPFVEPCKKDTVKLNAILESLIDEFESHQTAQYDMLQSYLKQFIIIAVRIQKELTPNLNTVDAQLFKDFNILVEQNFKKTHTVADYAQRLAVSPKSLSKNFNRVGAQSPSDIIKDRVILEAKRELLYTNLTVKEIAYGLGYHDAAYFTRFFTRSEKVSPLKYRKTNQKV